MRYELKNGEILSVNGKTIHYRRFDGQEFDYNSMFNMEGREEELVGQFLQVNIDTNPGNYVHNEAITPGEVD